MRRNRRWGASTIEMTLVGIPIIFTLISIFEMSRGMWMYHTMAYAVKAGVRFASVHGINCIYAPPGVTNNCPEYIANIAQQIQNNAVGLDPNNTLLTFNASGDITSCYLGSSSSSSISTPLGSGPGCLSLTTTLWPPATSTENAVGKPIRIDIRTRFRSALAMFWPGSAPVSFAEADLGASSTDFVQF